MRTTRSWGHILSLSSYGPRYLWSVHLFYRSRSFIFTFFSVKDRCRPFRYMIPSCSPRGPYLFTDDIKILVFGKRQRSPLSRKTRSRMYLIFPILIPNYTRPATLRPPPTTTPTLFSDFPPSPRPSPRSSTRDRDFLLTRLGNPPGFRGTSRDPTRPKRPSQVEFRDGSTPPP